MGEPGLAVEQQLDRPGLGRVGLEVALALQRLQVGVGGRAGSEAEGLADLADRGGIAALGHGLRDVPQGLKLAFRKPIDHDSSFAAPAAMPRPRMHVRPTVASLSPEIKNTRSICLLYIERAFANLYEHTFCGPGGWKGNLSHPLSSLRA